MALCWQTQRAFSWAKIYAIIWRHYATISQYIAIQFFMHFTIVMSPIIAKFCFCKFICTRLWGQLYGYRIYHQR